MALSWLHNREERASGKSATTKKATDDGRADKIDKEVVNKDTIDELPDSHLQGEHNQ